MTSLAGGQVEQALDEASGTLVPAVCYRLPAHSLPVHIYVDADENDEITVSIRSGECGLPGGYYLLQECAGQGSHVLDLGAHIGTFGLFAAAWGYDVISVEANSRNVALLSKSIEKNGFRNLRVVHRAVSEHRGTLEFIQAGPYGLVATPFLDVPLTTVAAAPVKEILRDARWDRVDFIKLDIEGSEIAAIRGMSELLARDDAPPILYESNAFTLGLRWESPAHLMSILEAHGYRCYLVDGLSLIPWHSSQWQLGLCVDCLALKRVPPMLRNWSIAPPMSQEELVERTLALCRDPSPQVRAYIAGELAKAYAPRVADPRLTGALAHLRRDAAPEVAAAIAAAEDAAALDRKQADIAEMTAALQEKDYEIVRLRATVAAYERGRFMRFMRWLHSRGIRF